MKAAAAAARVVLEAAESGCGPAASLVRRAAFRLARVVSRAAEEWRVKVFRVYGGLTKSRVYMETLGAGVRGGVVEEGRLDPAVGAVWLALQYYCDNLALTPWDVAVVFSDLDP